MLAEDGTGNVRGNVRKRRKVKKQDPMWVSLLVLHGWIDDPELINVGMQLRCKKSISGFTRTYPTFVE